MANYIYKYVRKAAAYARPAAALIAFSCAASCIYPFEPEVPEVEKCIVIEGNIFVGEYTEVNLSYLMPLNTPDSEMKSEKPVGKAWVEAEDGTVYRPLEDVEGSSFLIDTRKAPAKGRYRLCVEDTQNSRHYFSEWAAVNPEAFVDSLSYVSGDYDMTLCISAHSDEGRYFRWSYREDYKFHADYPKDYIFDYDANLEIKIEPSDYSTYWCWKSHSSKELGLVATADLKDNRIVNHKFLTFSRSSLRLQTRYRMSINMSCISADAYRYLDNLKTNSNFNGDLFTPVPSDVRGNIFCVEEPERNVIGYIDVCQVKKAVFYLGPDAYRLYIYNDGSFPSFIPAEVWDYGEDHQNPLDLRYFWNQGYAPMHEGTDANGKMGVLWNLKRCTDCRLDGGVLEAPEDWEDR